MFWSGGLELGRWLKVAIVPPDGPGDASELVSECDGGFVVPELALEPQRPGAQTIGLLHTSFAMSTATRVSFCTMGSSLFLSKERLWHLMPIKSQEESISSLLKLTKPGHLRSFAGTALLGSQASLSVS